MDKSNGIAQNVINMSDFFQDAGFAALSQVEAYWEALRADRVVPKRSDIDPRGLEGTLEYAFIVERISPGLARLRIAGSHLNDLMGMEVRGMPLTAFFTPPARRQVCDLVETVFQAPAMGRLQLYAAPRSDGGALDAQMILLPLSSDPGDVSRILGCLVAKGQPGQAPRRFDLLDQRIHPLLAENAGPILTQPPAARPTEVPGFSAPRGAFQPKKPQRRPHYLRVVKSDD
jgi:hypothetical protein